MSNNIERLIVLGAGASSGYPLGSELIEEIKKYSLKHVISCEVIVIES
jgi:hypothetical protein